MSSKLLSEATLTSKE